MYSTWLELTAAEVHQRDLIRDAEHERLVREARRLRREQSWWYRLWKLLTNVQLVKK
ncbi:hypothetical protein [uncultured Chloroflexus sp.]|uniref:hypothetical protein n=1 Tax=uncultured Chloroflexus sp. TaxID=214040 RepID=UPI002616F414|nr:hypothetical protein [uncultured Chloroflexus sp.]